MDKVFVGHSHLLSDGTRIQMIDAGEKMREAFVSQLSVLSRNADFIVQSMGLPEHLLGERERGITIRPQLPLPYAPEKFNPSEHKLDKSPIAYSPHIFVMGRFIEPYSYITLGRQCGKSRMRAQYLDEMSKHIMGVDTGSAKDRTVKLQISREHGKQTIW